MAETGESPKEIQTVPAAPAPPARPRGQVKRAPTRSRESIWTLRKSIPQSYRWPFALALPVALAVVWVVLTLGDKPLVNDLFLPSPGKVWHALFGSDGLFLRDQCWVDDQTHQRVCSVLHSWLLRCIFWSSFRIVVSFALAVAVAVPLGVLMGSFEPVNRLMDPIMAPLRYLPISAFIPLLILWLGIDEQQKIGFLFLGVFVYLLPVVITAIRSVPEELVQTALTLGATRAQVIRTVLVPAAMPDIFDSLRVMNAISWTYVILAEFVNTRYGLGHMIDLAGSHTKTAEVFAGIIVIGVIGLATDALIRVGSRAFFSWREVE